MLRRSFTVLCMLVVFSSFADAAETWAERLGYPPGKRVLILYANHMGAAYEFNRPGQELLARGLVQSVGVMPACPWFEEFAQWCRDNPGHDVGVCLSLTNPAELYRWRPVLDRQDVPSLVDADGYLWRSLLQFTLRADVAEVEREIDAQITKVRLAGIRPTHLIPDLGSLLTRPEFAELYLGAAQKYWIPAVIPEMTPAMIEELRKEGFPLTDEILEIVNRYPLPKVDGLKSVPECASYKAKRDAFVDLVRGLSPGISQIILHPADTSPALQRVSSRWQDLVWEAQLLLDPMIHKFLDEEGVMVTNWVQIMRRFTSEEEADTKSVASGQ